MKKIRRNSLTKCIYETFKCKYEQINPANETYFKIFYQLCYKYWFEIESINLKDIFL